MRHLPRAALLTVALAVGALTAAGCAGDAPSEPTLPSVNFTPRLVIEIHDSALAFVAGPRANEPGGAAVTLDPPAVASGTVVDIANLTNSDQRLQGDTTFDTGIMRPTEHTTVVLTNTTDRDLHLDITDPLHPEIKGSITVHPKPSAS